MWQNIAIIGVFFVLSIVFMRWQSGRIDELEEKLKTTKNEFISAKAEIEGLRQVANRQAYAGEALFERIQSGAGIYAEKVKEVETDQGSCDWLDALLPDSVRKYYDAFADDIGGCPAVVPAERMPKTADGGNENESGLDSIRLCP